VMELVPPILRLVYLAETEVLLMTVSLENTKQVLFVPVLPPRTPKLAQIA